jgi:hypothetical protein
MASGQFDFRGLLRKTNTHIADDVYPHKIPVLVPPLPRCCWSCAGADASRVARLQGLIQESDDEDELDEFEVFDIPAYEEVHTDEAVGASPLTPAHGRVKGLLKLPRSHENRRTEKRPLAWAFGMRSSLQACRAYFRARSGHSRLAWCMHLRRCASGCY